MRLCFTSKPVTCFPTPQPNGEAMASAFQQYFKQVGFPLLLDQFGEPTVYHFAGGGSRSITGIINRDPPAIYDAAGNVTMPELAIRYTSDCTIGVLPSEVNTGGDYVILIDEIGKSAPVRKAVMVKIREGQGVVELALR